MITQSFFIPTTLPSLNEIISAAKSGHGRGNAYSRMKKSVTDVVCWCAKEAKLEPMDKVTILFYWKEKSMRKDPDGFTTGKKFICDGLVKAGVLPDDGWKYIMGFSDKWEVDKENPGVYVELYDAAGETIIPVSLKTKDLPHRKPKHILGKGFD